MWCKTFRGCESSRGPRRAGGRAHEAGLQIQWVCRGWDFTGDGAPLADELALADLPEHGEYRKPDRRSQKRIARVLTGEQRVDDEHEEGEHKPGRDLGER